MVGDPKTTAATDERRLLRLIARHGTPTDHLLNGHPCPCWSDAKQVLRDLHGAGYMIVKEFDR